MNSTAPYPVVPTDAFSAWLGFALDSDQASMWSPKKIIEESYEHDKSKIGAVNDQEQCAALGGLPTYDV
jgi:hypothetical protein